MIAYHCHFLKDYKKDNKNSLAEVSIIQNSRISAMRAE